MAEAVKRIGLAGLGLFLAAAIAARLGWIGQGQVTRLLAEVGIQVRMPDVPAVLKDIEGLALAAISVLLFVLVVWAVGKALTWFFSLSTVVRWQNDAYHRHWLDRGNAWREAWRKVFRAVGYALLSLVFAYSVANLPPDFWPGWWPSWGRLTFLEDSRLFPEGSERGVGPSRYRDAIWVSKTLRLGKLGIDSEGKLTEAGNEMARKFHEDYRHWIVARWDDRQWLPECWEWRKAYHRRFMEAFVRSEVQAFHAGRPTSSFWEGAHTVASGLRVPKALGDFLVLQALRETGGYAIAVSDDALLQAMQELAALEGLWVCPEGAATVAALPLLRDLEVIHPSDRVLILNTGSGLKYPHLVSLSLPVSP